MKYIIPLVSAFLIFRYLARNKIADISETPSSWMIKPSGYQIFNIPENWFSSYEKNVFQWSQKAMLWGIELKLDPALIMACIFAESAGNPNAKRWESNRNEYSYGLMQILWSTANDIVGWLKDEPFGEGKPGNYIPSAFVLTADDMLIPNLNILLGTRYLTYQYYRYTGVYGKAKAQYMFSAYNAGSVPSSGVFVNPDYVNKCINAAQKYRYYLNNTYPNYLTMFPREIWAYSAI